ncbi:secreted RxLR effector peptide protein, putative [Phytophthora infestans T30-4]|uniref:RxLR effector protein n=1 Tax=Phytophthora infestans (strain T30-4) TaxID=403677 RepID=D0N6C4_PHYIT|nr:secreted RxLR effector peptide protein, putative [Phytophthora infestans T30-4]EEY70615.1 secreted RxLR effector peptide protein, putative [Phytophthora infestans T30-4]|eukprot:XP_002998269.1 secreted RxLR effector peptide protein, putative [Phytophthora infestans T30-4]
MRLNYVLLAAASTLLARHVTSTPYSANDVALTGVMSLGFIHFVGADQSVSDQSRFLRGGNIDEYDNEERSFVEVVKQAMIKNNFVNKLMKKNSFSDIEKIDDLGKLKRISVAADDQLNSAFKLADDAKMSPDDLAKVLKEMPGADDALTGKAKEMYTEYLKTVGGRVHT